MSDDLVTRLREWALENRQQAWGRADGGQDLSIGAAMVEEAADRIAALEARAEKAEADRAALRPTSPDEARELYQKLRLREPMFLEDWRRMGVGLQDIVDDLVDVIEWLRDEQDYAKSDRLRTLAGRLARQVPNYPVFDALNDDLVRTQARTWPNQLTIKESKAIEARAEKAEAERDALREALKEVVSEYDNPDNGRTLRWAIDEARAALNREAGT